MLQLKGAIGIVSDKTKVWNREVVIPITSSTATHIFVVVRDPTPDEPALVLEATMSGVVVHPLTKYLNHKELGFSFHLYLPSVPRAEIHKAVDGLWYLAGKKYGIIQYIGLGIVLLIRKLTGKRFKNPLGMNIICSELGTLYAKRLKAPAADKLDRDTVTPGDVEQQLIKPYRNYWIPTPAE